MGEEEDKEKESEKILDVVQKTINRQILGLATSVAFYNLHQSIAKPNEDPLTVTVGGVKYTGNIQVLKRRFEIEENYWRNFMNFFIGQNPIFFSSDSPSGSAKHSPPPGFERVGESIPQKGTYSGPLNPRKISRVPRFNFLVKKSVSGPPEVEEDPLLKTTSF
jgi:hypothetical protein